MASCTPLLLALFTLGSGTLAGQPSLPVEPQPAPVSLRHIDLDIALDLERRTVDGTARLRLHNYTTQRLSAIPLLVGRLLRARSVTVDGSEARFTQPVVEFEDDPVHQVRQITVELPRRLEPGKETTIEVRYSGSIVGLTEVGYLYVQDKVDSAYSLLRADAHAFPLPEVSSNRANRLAPSHEFTYSVRADVPTGFTAVTGGQLLGTDSTPSRTIWRYRNDDAVPFIFVAVSRFRELRSRVARIYHLPEDSTGASGLAAALEKSHALLSEWYGAPGRRATLTIIEIPERWGSQASASAGIILQASAFRDSAQRRELYHELVHLWNPPDLEAPSPRWNEGLSSFLERLIAERVDGVMTRRASENRSLANLGRNLEREPRLRTIPPAKFGDNRMTDWSYSVGRIMFALLYEVTGEKNFHEIYRTYIARYPRGGRAEDLYATVRSIGGDRAAAIVSDWLLTTRWTESVSANATIESLAARIQSSK